MKKKLYRSQKNNIISGLLGGLSEYFDVDASLVRLGYLFLVAITGFIPFVVVYIIGSLIVPLEAEKNKF